MKTAYPVLFRECKGDKVPFYVYVPDLDVSTQGMDMADAIDMARDVIQLTIVHMQDCNEDVPEPGKNVIKKEDGDIISYVDVDPDSYRIVMNNLSVKKNCTVPQWLAKKAEDAGINFSQTLQKGLKAELGIA